jgi:hypothetical protein
VRQHPEVDYRVLGVFSEQNGLKIQWIHWNLVLEQLPGRPDDSPEVKYQGGHVPAPDSLEQAEAVKMHLLEWA